MGTHSRATGAITVTGPDGRIVANLSRETMLRPSTPQVQVDAHTAEALRSLLAENLISEEAAPMPDEVWARIEAALEEEAGAAHIGEHAEESWAGIAYLENKLRNS